ncbi:MAG: hypothetical protein Q8P79_02250, partial [Nanoarchaeota archaeon]|nr:hypothetical protein [Nanoarchaeota archaeon]
MRLNSRFLFYGIFVLVAILGIYFVLGDSYNLAPLTAKATETKSMIAFNVTNATLNNSNFPNVIIALMGNASVGNVTNVTISNVTKTFFNTTNGGFNSTGLTTITLNVPANISTGGTNWTVNLTLSSSATYGFTVGAQVKAIGNTTSDNLSYSVLPYTSQNLTITESTAPVATATCSPKEVYMGDSFPCTCSGTDSGTTDSGVATTSGSSNAPDGTSIP